MELLVEDYSVFISKYSESLVEVDISRKGSFITGSFTTNIMDLSGRIVDIIKKNELQEFGYIRFSLKSTV